MPVYQFKWYLFFQIEESKVPLEPPPQFVETKKIVQDTPVKKESSQATMLVSPVKSSPNHTRPSAHVSPTINPMTTQHSVISVDSGTSVRGSDKAYGVVGTYNIN